MMCGIKRKPVFCFMAGIFLFLSSLNAAAQDGGYDVFSGLWLKTVLRTSAGDFTLVWKEVGRDMTPGGDKVISGYFYADPDEFAYGSEYNPEIFVKIYAASNGWANIAFNHVTVDNADVYSAHNYSGTAQQSGTVTLNSRLAEHSYTGVSADADFTPPVSGSEASVYQDGGYLLFSDLWAKSVLRTAAGSVTLKWKVVGNDTTPSGDKVISGYFYADPDDFAFGSEYNPEMFVKVYVAANGWSNIAFNHVTVDPVDVYSAHSYKGRPDSTGSAALGSRLVEHSYTGVPLQPVISYTGHWLSKKSVVGTGGSLAGNTDQFYIDIHVTDDGSFNGFGGIYICTFPINCFSLLCTWYCGWPEDSKFPVSGYIDKSTDTGVIRIQGFDGEKAFTVIQDAEKPGKLILELEDDEWTITEFVIYPEGYTADVAESKDSDLKGRYTGTFSTNSYVLYGTYDATLTFSDDRTGHLSVEDVDENYYSSTVTVLSFDDSSVTISFADADGDEIRATLTRDGNTLKGSWYYTDPQYDASGKINVTK